MESLISVVGKLLSTHEYHPVVVELLKLILNNQLSGLERDKVLSMHGIRRISDMKEHTLVVILDYAFVCLEDGKLEDAEMHNMKMLKLFFGIEEGDFYKNNLESKVNAIIGEQLRKIYADGVVDYEEALHMGDLQNLFGLSYGQFETIVKQI